MTWPIFRGEPIKFNETPTKEKPVKVTPTKVKPGKGKPDVNPDSMEAESTGKPDQLVVKQVGTELKEYESDTDFGEGVSEELAKEIDELEKK